MGELSQRLEDMLAKLAAVKSREENPDRHKIKHVNGSFWRERKEQKKRTLFMGGFPADYTAADVTELIHSVEGAAGAVQSVDFIGEKQVGQRKLQNRPRNAFVLLTSIDAAHAALSLYGMKLGLTALRVNFSDDRSQRAAAIAKRGAPQHSQAQGKHQRARRQ